MNRYFTKGKFAIFGFDLIFSIFIYFYAITNFSLPSLQNIRITQIFGLTSIGLLYLSLIIVPLISLFPKIKYRDIIQDSQKPLVLSTFYFSLLHTLISFFGLLGGFEGLGFLSNNYLIAISISFTALLLLLIAAFATFESTKKLYSHLRWEVFFHLLYVVGILGLIHALLLGTHFKDLFAYIPQIVFLCLSSLLILEGLRLDKILDTKYGLATRFNYASLIMGGLVLAGSLYYFLPAATNGSVSFGIHSQHIQLAKEAQQNTTPSRLTNIPGMQGDRTKRFTVNMQKPEILEPGQEIPLTFTVYDAGSGNQIKLFNEVYDKLLHLIIVDSSLTYFAHIHPDFEDGSFTITTSLPKAGIYHLYLDFQPFGAIEQQIGMTLNVGNSSSPTFSTAKPDTNLTKIFGDYAVTLSYPHPLKASQMAIGEQLMTFEIRDAKTKKPTTTLKPYLSSFGHMVMINQVSFDYLHIHPANLSVPQPNENGGPKIQFMPLGLYGPIRPGIYRVFTQFNPNGNLLLTDFTIKIE